VGVRFLGAREFNLKNDGRRKKDLDPVNLVGEEKDTSGGSWTGRT